MSLFLLLPLVSSFAQGAPSQPVEASVAGSTWSAEVATKIRREEYAYQAVSNEPGVWSAPNRSQELRSRVSSAGLEVFPRATSADGVGATWRLSLWTASFGRVGDVIELGPARELRTSARTDASLELDHGMLVEWFVNDERGIEQGWTIEERPAGVDPLRIGLELGGDLSLRIDAGARSAVLVDGCGDTKLRYRDLIVFDASGRELDARLSPSPAGVGIEIDDAGAVYPLTVDPLLTGPAWTGESDQAGAQYGSSVATAGDVNGDGFSDVIVGAPFYDNGQSDEGRAFVYLGSASGLSSTPSWTADGDQASEHYGRSVATAGDVNGDGFSDVIVGATGYSNGETTEGRAVVYLGSASGLANTPSWTAEGDHSDAYYGGSVATAGDVNGDGFSDVIVGAPYYDDGHTDDGRALVYLGSASGLSSTPSWTAEGDQTDAHYGGSVATAGDVNGDGYSDVIVGAPEYSNGQVWEGRAFVYLGSASGLSSTPSWTAEGDQQDGAYGSTVATAGDVNGDGFSDVIVGAPISLFGGSGPGRAFVYLGSASGLSSTPSWTHGGDHAFARYGASVATAGDVNGDGYSDVIVGATGYSNGETSEGRAVVYLGSASGLATTSSWAAESDQAQANYGKAVATAGDVNGDGFSDVLVGANQYHNGQVSEGGAFLYSGSALGLSASPGWTRESNQASASYGVAVATAGDVNGDGFSDVVVGAPLYDNGQVDEGRAFVYLGAESGLSSSPSWTAESDQADAQYGTAAATAGDVNGDGYSDVIVGAYGYDNGEANEGRAFVYLGSSSGLSVTPSWTGESDQAGAQYGFSVATAGDVNGDGYSDAIVGAFSYDNGEANEGRAFVYLGSSSGLSGSPSWTAESDQTGASYGRAVATAGDANGDGFSDVIVGAPDYDDGQVNEGRAFVYSGSRTGLSASASWSAESDQASAAYGFDVATAGDVNGDGFSDVIVGAPLYDNGQTDEGRAFVHLGSSSGLSVSPSWTVESDQAGVQYGCSVATAGDVNGDGHSDVIVGALAYTNGHPAEGRAFIYLGSSSGLSVFQGWTAEGNQSGAAFGARVSTAGDVNGDGFADVIVGAPGYDNGQTEEGRAFAYYGTEGHGSWLRTIGQRTRNGANPIAVVGDPGPGGLFRVRAGFRKNLTAFTWASPASPTAWLEWELKPLGVAFDGSGIEQSASQSLVPPGGTLTFDELTFANDGVLNALLTSPQSYHWRARIATNNPLFPHTAWFGVQGSNLTEAKLRRP